MRWRFSAAVTAAACRFRVVPFWPLGGEVLDLDPRTLEAEAPCKALSAELAERGVLAFKGLNLSDSEFLSISGLLGKELISRHVVHPESPSEDILRLSNQAQHGVVGVGPQWHQDGSTEQQVFSHLLFHAKTRSAATLFADARKAFELLPPQTQEKWARIASVNAYSGAVHPLVHEHPVSGKKVLFLHLGQTGALITRSDLNSELADLSFGALPESEVRALFAQLHALLSRPELHLSYTYEAGDLVLVDNLAVLHRASEAAFEASAWAPLRVLHRATVRGNKNLGVEGLPPYLYIFGENPFDPSGLWQSSDYYGVGFRWNRSQRFQN
ncbi:unnamed protein product [Effrenium voratum]|nr:unnamed protein product [Effrenium voratum]